MTFCETNTVDVMQRYVGLFHGVLDHSHGPLTMMLRCVAGQEALSRRGDVGVPDIRQHCGGTVWRVLDYSCSKFVC